MLSDDVSTITVSRDSIDPRYTYIESLRKWVTHADERLWDDYPTMMQHLNDQEIAAAVAGYEAHLRTIAKKALSRPAKKSKLIEVGRFAGQMSQAKPAFVPTDKAINTWVKRQLKAVRDYLVWVTEQEDD